MTDTTESPFMFTVAEDDPEGLFKTGDRITPEQQWKYAVPVKRSFDQVEFEGIEHAYVYRDSLIVLEPTASGDLFDVVHIVLPDDTAHVVELVEGAETPESALGTGARQVDEYLRTGQHGVEAFSVRLRNIQHEFSHGAIWFKDRSE